MDTSNPGAVFLSHAREDTDAAQRIAGALRAAGIDVWFEQSEPRGSDTWEWKIRQQISDCTLFLPIVSQHTQQRPEGNFRLEWKLAVERMRFIPAGKPFLAPVALDTSHETNAIVPPEFMSVQWTRLPQGQPTPEFIEQIKRQLSTRGKITPAPGREPLRTSSMPTAPLPPDFAFRLTVLIAVLALLGGALYFALRPKAKEPAVPPKSEAQAKPE